MGESDREGANLCHVAQSVLASGPAGQTGIAGRQPDLLKTGVLTSLYTYCMCVGWRNPFLRWLFRKVPPAHAPPV
jgi:hypothetical protein